MLDLLFALLSVLYFWSPIFSTLDSFVREFKVLNLELLFTASIFFLSVPNEVKSEL